MSKTIEDKVAMDINSFCRNEKGEWVREREYEYIFKTVIAEYDNGSYGEYLHIPDYLDHPFRSTLSTHSG